MSPPEPDGSYCRFRQYRPHGQAAESNCGSCHPAEDVLRHTQYNSGFFLQCQRKITYFVTSETIPFPQFLRREPRITVAGFRHDDQIGFIGKHLIKLLLPVCLHIFQSSFAFKVRPIRSSEPEQADYNPFRLPAGFPLTGARNSGDAVKHPAHGFRLQFYCPFFRIPVIIDWVLNAARSPFPDPART